nr:Dihydrofolate reductase [uncultured bacterium]
MKNLSVIVAVAENGVIGREGHLPWRLSADLQRFKRLTMGHHLIMGRRTFESIGRPLPGRTTIVVTRQTNASWPGVLTAHSLEEAYRMASSDNEMFVVGGGEIYRQALADAERLYLTLVHADVEGDTRFVDVDWSLWELVEEEHREADQRNTAATTFCVYKKKN